MDDETASSLPTKSFNKEMVAKVENPSEIVEIKKTRRRVLNRYSARKSALEKKQKMAEQIELIRNLTSQKILVEEASMTRNEAFLKVEEANYFK
jgi:hypothetical protein